MAETEYTHPTLDKIASLKRKFKDPAYPDDLTRISSWESEVKNLVARESLAQDPALSDTIDGYQKDVAEWEEQIRTQDSETLPDKKRDRLLDKVAMYKDFIRQFALKDVREALASIDKMVDDELAVLN